MVPFRLSSCVRRSGWPGAHGQHGGRALNGLDFRLLVDAHRQRALGRVPVIAVVVGLALACFRSDLFALARPPSATLVAAISVAANLLVAVEAAAAAGLFRSYAPDQGSDRDAVAEIFS